MGSYKAAISSVLLVWSGWVPNLVQGGGHREEQGKQELQEEQHTVEAPLQMCFSRILQWLAPFLVVRLSLYTDSILSYE